VNVKPLRFAAIILAGMLLAVACDSSSSSPSPSAVSPGTSASPGAPTDAPAPEQVEQVTIALADTDFTLTALDWNYGYPGVELVKLQYDTLVTRDTDNNPQPLLATAWESNATATEWTFTLRDGVKWHDGMPFTADDVVHTIQYHNDIVQKSLVFTMVRGWTAEAVDPLTVKIITPAPEPDIALKLNLVWIQPKHVWDGVGAGLDVAEAEAAYRAVTDHTGTGPYKMDTLDPEAFYTLVANDDYFLGPPSVKKLQFVIIQDPTARLAALRSGEVDAVASAVPPESQGDLPGPANLNLLQGPAFGAMTLALNNTRAPFDDATVRKALGLAIDPQELVDVAMLGEAVTGNQGYLHPSLASAEAGLTLNQDVAEANRILDDAGYRDTDGDGVRESPDGNALAIDLGAVSTAPVAIRGADLIGEWAREIGIQVTTQSIESNAFFEMVWPSFDRTSGGVGDYDAMMMVWSAAVMNVPAAALDQLYHSDPIIGRLNVQWYSNATTDALLDELRAELDPAERDALIRQIQVQVAGDLPFAVLWYPNETFAFDQEVYDGWRFLNGTGIIQKLSFLPQVFP
jgi:peptide/nickel transport system substrate-binding protein